MMSSSKFIAPLLLAMIVPLAVQAQGITSLWTTTNRGTTVDIDLSTHGTSAANANLAWLTYDSLGQPQRKDTDMIPLIDFNRTPRNWRHNDGEDKWFSRMSWSDGEPITSGSMSQNGMMLTDDGSGKSVFTIDRVGGTASNPWSIDVWGYERTKDVAVSVEEASEFKNDWSPCASALRDAVVSTGKQLPKLP